MRRCLVLYVLTIGVGNSFRHGISKHHQRMLPDRRVAWLEKQRNLDELLDGSPETVAEPLSPEEERSLLEDLQVNGPSEMEKRMNLLGINNWTLAGFAVAFILFVLNSVLGTGWLGDYLGMNAVITEAPSAQSMSEDRAKQMETMSKGVVINYKDIQDRLKVH